MKQTKGTTGLTDVFKREGSTKYYDHEDNAYNSLYELGRTYGVSVSTLTSRLLSGWSAEKSLTTPVADRNNGHKIKYDGKIFGSYVEICMYTGISVELFRTRRNNGHTIEDSLLSIRDFKIKFDPIVDHLGNKFATLQEMCDFHSVPLYRFHKRKKNGCTIEECLSQDEVGVDALKELLESE